MPHRTTSATLYVVCHASSLHAPTISSCRSVSDFDIMSRRASPDALGLIGVVPTLAGVTAGLNSSTSAHTVHFASLRHRTDALSAVTVIMVRLSAVTVIMVRLSAVTVMMVRLSASDSAWPALRWPISSFKRGGLTQGSATRRAALRAHERLRLSWPITVQTMPQDH